jgi:hypothetical protein
MKMHQRCAPLNRVEPKQLSLLKTCPECQGTKVKRLTIRDIRRRSGYKYVFVTCHCS